MLTRHLCYNNNCSTLQLSTFAFREVVRDIIQARWASLQQSDVKSIQFLQSYPKWTVLRHSV